MQKSKLAMTMSLALTSTFAVAEDIETITVTATRAANLSGVPAVQQLVIDRQQIELAQVQSLPELLSRYAGLDIAQNGGRGQQASVFVRGASSDQTLVLINGLRINSASSGGASWSTISPELIDRIEVIKGPRAAVWGSDAIGGVINLITRQHQPGTVELGTFYGTDNTQSYYAGGGIGHGDGSTSVIVNHESSDGFDVLKSAEPDDDGYDNLNVTVNGQQRVTEQFGLSWLLKAAEQDTDFDSTYLNSSENKSHELKLASDIDWSVGDTANTTVISVGASRDASLSFGNGRSQENGDLFETRREQVSLVNTSQLHDSFTLAIGTDIYEEALTSTTAYAETERLVRGYFGHGLYHQGKVSAELALRYDDVENINSERTYNASVGYQFTDAFSVSVLKGTGFKAPTFNDLYFPWGGNPDLLSETSESEEVVFSYVEGPYTVSVSGYDTTIENLIEWAPDAQNVWQPRNIANADIRGVDVEFAYQGFGGQHNFSLGYLDAVDEATNARLDRRAKNQFGYQFTTKVGEFDLLLSYEYKGKRYDRGNALDSYQIVDISLAYAISDTLTAKAKLQNLFDEEYETVFDYNPQGRAVHVGLKYQL